jgi:hypothetical protein
LKEYLVEEREPDAIAEQTMAALRLPWPLVSRLAAEAERQGIAPRELALRLLEEGLKRQSPSGEGVTR